MAYNSNSTRIATTDGQRIVVRGCLRPEDRAIRSQRATLSSLDGGERGDALDSEWDVSSMVVESTAGRVTAMEWLGIEHGHVLVCGTTTGVVIIYSEDPNDRRDGCAAAWYGMKGVLRYSTSSVTCIKAGDASLSVDGSPVVAVGYKDGTIRLFEYNGRGSVGIGWQKGTPQLSGGLTEGEDAEETLWSVHSVISSPLGTDESCLCMDMKYPKGEEGDMTLLVAGYAGCGSPQLYMYNPIHFVWHHVDVILSSEDDAGDGDGRNTHENKKMHTGVDAVAWAPLMGRQHDLIAVASGSDVTLWSLSGPLDSMSVERIAVLTHENDVWQLGWNMTGTWLAASTHSNTVCLWRPDLAGEWMLLHTIEGVTS